MRNRKIGLFSDQTISIMKSLKPGQTYVAEAAYDIDANDFRKHVPHISNWYKVLIDNRMFIITRRVEKYEAPIGRGLEKMINFEFLFDTTEERELKVKEFTMQLPDRQDYVQIRDKNKRI